MTISENIVGLALVVVVQSMDATIWSAHSESSLSSKYWLTGIWSGVSQKVALVGSGHHKWRSPPLASLKTQAYSRQIWNQIEFIGFIHAHAHAFKKRNLFLQGNKSVRSKWIGIGDVYWQIDSITDIEAWTIDTVIVNLSSAIGEMARAPRLELFEFSATKLLNRLFQPPLTSYVRCNLISCVKQRRFIENWWLDCLPDHTYALEVLTMIEFRWSAYPQQVRVSFVPLNQTST
jgi:hypothetical protein